jgi:hypothetical protein
MMAVQGPKRVWLEPEYWAKSKWEINSVNKSVHGVKDIQFTDC